MHDSHGMEPDYGTGPKTLRIYIIGFVLCILLTLIPFYVVITNKFSILMTFVVIFISALLQFLAQVIFFLRLNVRTTQAQINVVSFVLTIGMVITVILGSLWIMWNLNYNMMH